MPDPWLQVFAALDPGTVVPTPSSWPAENSRRVILSDSEQHQPRQQLPRLRRKASDEELLALIDHIGGATTSELTVVLRMHRHKVHERLYSLVQQGHLEPHRGGWRAASKVPRQRL